MHDDGAMGVIVGTIGEPELVERAMRRLSLFVRWADGREELHGVDAPRHGEPSPVVSIGAGDYNEEVWLHSPDDDAVRVVIHGDECPLVILRGGGNED